MTQKHSIAMGYTVCPVCGCKNDGKEVLIAKRGTPFTDSHVATGYELCPRDQEKVDNDYLPMIECTDESHSIQEANRTGNIYYIKRDKWSVFFKSEIPTTPFVFISTEVGELLREAADTPDGSFTLH